MSRIFTTLQEVPDKLILYGFIAGFTLNAIIAAQMVYYWDNPKSSATTQTKVESKGTKAATQAVGMDGQARGISTGSQRGKTTPSTRRRG